MGMGTALSTEMANSFDPNKIAADVTTSLITEAVKSGWEKVKKFFKDSEAKDSIDFGDAYACYLQNTVEKNSKIKTLIYRHVPKDLYSFYEYVNVRYQNRKINTSDIGHLLQISNKLIITGTGGLGKSLLLKHFFLNTVQNSNYIPVLIELRKFNGIDSSKVSLYDAIYQNLSENGFKLEDEYYSYSLNEGAYVILLDGFDEINHDKVGKIFEQIQSFSDRYNKNHFIISSRPSDRFVGWTNFHEMSLCNLTKEQAIHMIQKLDYDSTLKNHFSKALDSELFVKYKSFTSNPLLLTIMLLTFNSHATIPENINDFYEQAFLTLFNMHDATKDYFVRDIRSHLSCEEFKKVFAHICICSYFAEDFEFSESKLRQYILKAKTKINNQSFSVDDFKEDLTLSVCMLVKDGLTYHFIHRSFQEYFAAWHTRTLPDAYQYTLLTELISKPEIDSLASPYHCTFNEYIKMLFNLQDDKVNRTILCPGIQKIKERYDTLGFSCNFLRELFEGISIRAMYSTHNGTQKYFYSIGLFPEDNYLCNIVGLTCSLNKYPIQNSMNAKAIQESLSFIVKKCNDFYKKIGIYGINDNCNVPEITFCSFTDLEMFVNPEQLLYCLEWYHDRLKYCFNIYNKYTQSSDLPLSAESILNSI